MSIQKLNLLKIMSIHKKINTIIHCSVLSMNLPNIKGKLQEGSVEEQKWSTNEKNVSNTKWCQEKTSIKLSTIVYNIEFITK